MPNAAALMQNLKVVHIEQKHPPSGKKAGVAQQVLLKLV
jgi:hypothetical protein